MATRPVMDDRYSAVAIARTCQTMTARNAMSPPTRTVAAWPVGRPLTGSLAELIRFFGEWDADVQLRFTSKFANVSSLLELPHGGRTRMRASSVV